MNAQPIKTEKEYQAALVRLDAIFGADPNTAEGDELEVLSGLILDYEKINFPDWPSCRVSQYLPDAD